jgi:hypothetical protein
MVASTLFLKFDIDLLISNVDALQWGLFIDFSTSSEDWLTSGCAFRFGGETRAKFVLETGTLTLAAVGESGLKVNHGLQPVTKITPSAATLETALAITLSNGLGSVGVVDSLKFYLAQFGVTTGRTGQAVGSITIIPA